MGEASGFRVGDVVHVVVSGTPHGFGVVMDVDGGLLRLHDGTHTRRCHYMHAGWCRKVGRVGPDVVEMAEASHRFVADLDAEREARGAAGLGPETWRDRPPLL